MLATGLATYPDATVVCGALESDPEDRNAVVNPKGLVEVLRGGTEQYDRGEKLMHYQKIPSLRAVLLVAQAERRIELWVKDGDQWSRTEARGGESIRIAAIDCRLDVDAIYDRAGAP